MEDDFMQAELKTKDVAEIFSVKPGTVSDWAQSGRLAGTLPRNARRIGRRFTVEAVLKFAEEANDDGYTERQAKAWLARNRARIIEQQRTGNTSTSVLVSGI